MVPFRNLTTYTVIMLPSYVHLMWCMCFTWMSHSADAMYVSRFLYNFLFLCISCGTNDKTWRDPQIDINSLVWLFYWLWYRNVSNKSIKINFLGWWLNKQLLYNGKPHGTIENHSRGIREQFSSCLTYPIIMSHIPCET